MSRNTTQHLWALREAIPDLVRLFYNPEYHKIRGYREGFWDKIQKIRKDYDIKFDYNDLLMIMSFADAWARAKEIFDLDNWPTQNEEPMEN